jgi:alkanesulfonate monooxygenase SsuD/methylene tetrahydromethanopterin reductase-like flavin-dependent oxidoreductase (luciferase family)
MLGGSGPALLRLAGEEADILNMVPPTGGRFGKLVLEDAMKFDVAEFRRRAAIARDHARAAGRDPRAIELSQFVFVSLGADRAAADGMLQMMAATMGVTDVEVARQSPNVLVGDAAGCRDEVARRTSDLGVSYFLCRFADLAAVERFGNEVIGRL